MFSSGYEPDIESAPVDVSLFDTGWRYIFAIIIQQADECVGFICELFPVRGAELDE